MNAIDLMDIKQIAALLGVGREHTRNILVKRPDFPAPAINVSQRVRKWKRTDVLKWAGVK